ARPATRGARMPRELGRVSLTPQGQVERQGLGGSSKAVTVQILDLSGGGLLLHVPAYRPLPLGVGHRVRITLPLRHEAIQVRGQVVRAIACEDGSARYAVEFQEISERDRDRIIGFVLQEEVRQRKLID